MIARHGNFLPRVFIEAAILALAATLIGSCSLSNQSVSTPGNRYALVIGVQDYPDYNGDNSNDLSYPDDDADDMAKLLTAQGWTVEKRLISSSDTSIDKDGSPTYSNIREAIVDLSSDNDATILVYYSGHGNLENGTAYIIPYDGLTTTGTGYDIAKWITPATLRSWMETVPAKNRVLILDSCYSGGFTVGTNAVDTTPADYSQAQGTTAEAGLLLAALSDFNGMVAANLASLGERDLVALSAAGSDEVSWDDGNSGHGAFTNYLLEAVDSGDADGDGYVTVAEAYAYAKANIKKNWNPEYKYYYGSTRNEWDFLPHISGGTGDIALYAPGT